MSENIDATARHDLPIGGLFGFQFYDVPKLNGYQRRDTVVPATMGMLLRQTIFDVQHTVYLSSLSEVGLNALRWLHCSIFVQLTSESSRYTFPLRARAAGARVLSITTMIRPRINQAAQMGPARL